MPKKGKPEDVNRKKYRPKKYNMTSNGGHNISQKAKE
jgi:hypothetical protein